MKMRTIPLALCVMLLAACHGFYTGIVSLAATVDLAAKAYAHCFNAGLVPPDVAAKVQERYANYQRCAGVARDALVAFKASGDPAQKALAFATATQAASEFVALVIPLIAPTDAATIKAQLAKANAL